MIVSDWHFSQRSIDRLVGVDPRLALIASRALAYSLTYDFGISSGLRTEEEQRALVEKGASRTMKSKHLEGKAIDFYVIDPATGSVTWDFEKYRIVADCFQRAADELHINIRWGGSFTTFKDGPHIELV